MILRLLKKIGFKALLPVAAVVGLVSYMSYTNSGDSASTEKRLTAQVSPGAATEKHSSPAHNIVDDLGNVHASGDDRARDGVQSVARATAAVTGDSEATANSSGTRTVYRWLDSAGGVQFGTHPEADAREITAIGLRPATGSDKPSVAAAKPRKKGYPAGKSHTELLLHVSAGE